MKLSTTNYDDFLSSLNRKDYSSGTAIIYLK